MGYGLLCGLWVWRRRTKSRPCCPPMSNPSNSPWTAWPDGSGRWDNRIAAQHLPRDQTRPNSGLKNYVAQKQMGVWNGFSWVCPKVCIAKFFWAYLPHGQIIEPGASILSCCVYFQRTWQTFSWHARGRKSPDRYIAFSVVSLLVYGMITPVC